MADTYDSLRITVQRIANGFIVSSGKDEGYSFIEGDGTYYATMEETEAALIPSLRNAVVLTRETGKEDF